MRKVIVNSTPLIALGKTGKLNLLRKMYNNITIPKAVFEEVTKKNDIVKREIIDADWISIEEVSDLKNKRMYSAKLHAGEVEVMILAQEYEGEHLVIIDDNAARKTADFLGLTMTGTLGVLVKAKMLGHIESVMPIIKRMEQQEIYFSEKLKEEIRKITNE